MKPTVYIETTIISYLTCWPSRDIHRLSHEMLTRNWWTKRDRFDLCTSEQVVIEASAGDASAAAERLKALKGIPLLPIPEPALSLSARLMQAMVLPERAKTDAIHVAVAAVNGIAFLLTWNCRHLANARNAAKIEQSCLDAGFIAPRIVTPEMLSEAP
jgi:hypothetical protein